MRGQIFFINKQQNPSTATELIHLALRIVIEKIRVCKADIIFFIIIIELYLNTVLFHKLLTFNLIIYKREGKEKM